MADVLVPPAGGRPAEQRVSNFFEALKALRVAEDLASQPLGKGDPVLAARIKELKGYIDVFLKAEIGRKPRLVVLEQRRSDDGVLPVEVYFRDAVQFFDALSLSLSKGGIFIKTDSLLAIDTLLALSCKLEAEGVHFKVSGKVIWINPRESQGRPQGMGVKLHKLTTVQRQILADFMAGELPPSALEHLTD